MKAQLINVGRNNVNKTIICKDIKALCREIKKHILSPNWEMCEAETPDTYVVFAGINPVGEVKILER